MKSILVLLAVIFSSYILFFDDSLPSKENVENNEIVSDKSDAKVYIRGLDNFNKEDLNIVKTIIENKYGVICKIESPITTSYQNDGNKDCDLIQEELGLTNTYDGGEPITIYITNSKINTNGTHAYGLSYGKTIYLSHDSDCPSFIKKSFMEMSAIHELSHSFGMDHCDDYKCIMNGYFDAKGSLPFCEKHMEEALAAGFRP
jgi:hypothetical protein